MKRTKIISSHNHFIGAVWTAVHCAQKTRNQCFRVVQLPRQQRWTVVTGQATKQKAAFTVKSYHSRAEHKIACTAAGDAIKKWQNSLYQEFTTTGSTKCIPRRISNETHEQLLLMAVLKNHAIAIAQLVLAGANVNYRAGNPLRIAVQRNKRVSALALLNSGASIKATQYLLYSPFYGRPKRWQSFLAALVGHIKTAELDENLPMFVELAEIAQEPACRRIVMDLAGKYPGLLAKLL